MKPAPVPTPQELLERRASMLLLEAQREANEQGVAQAIVIEGHKVWIWRNDWLSAAMRMEPAPSDAGETGASQRL
jgi:hypothetical protein